MRKLVVLFGICTLLCLLACSPVNHKYDGYWIVDAKYGKRKLNADKVKQWKIEGGTVLTTVNFSADVALMGYRDWPGENLDINFINDSTVTLSNGLKVLNMQYDYKDYGVMGMETLTFTMSNNDTTLQIDLLHYKTVK